MKEKPGYVKFLPEWAPGQPGALPGRGTRRGAGRTTSASRWTTAEVMAQLARVKAAGLPVREEMGVDCCHANQDKFWVQDPDGVEWEVYHLNYDLEDEVPRRPAP